MREISLLNFLLNQKTIWLRIIERSLDHEHSCSLSQREVSCFSSQSETIRSLLWSLYFMSLRLSTSSADAAFLHSTWLVNIFSFRSPSFFFESTEIHDITDLQLFIESDLKRFVNWHVLQYKFLAFVVQLSKLLQDFVVCHASCILFQTEVISHAVSLWCVNFKVQISMKHWEDISRALIRRRWTLSLQRYRNSSTEWIQKMNRDEIRLLRTHTIWTCSKTRTWMRLMQWEALCIYITETSQRLTWFWEPAQLLLYRKIVSHRSKVFSKIFRFSTRQHARDDVDIESLLESLRITVLHVEQKYHDSQNLVVVGMHSFLELSHIIDQFMLENVNSTQSIDHERHQLGNSEVRIVTQQRFLRNAQSVIFYTDVRESASCYRDIARKNGLLARLEAFIFHINFKMTLFVCLENTVR